MALTAAALPHDKELLGRLILCALVEADGTGGHLGGDAMPLCLQSATSGLMAYALLGCAGRPCMMGTADIQRAARACVFFLGNAALRHEQWAVDLLLLLARHGVNTEVAYAHNRARLQALENTTEAAHTGRDTLSALTMMASSARTQWPLLAPASAVIAALTTRPVLGGTQAQPCLLYTSDAADE